MATSALTNPTKTLRIGYSLYSPYYEKCSFENPITCDLPGASMEAVWLLEQYYGAKFQFIDHKGYGFGASSETDTIFRGLLNGSIHTAGGTMWYISERVTNLPNFSFPLGSESLGAVLKANSSLISSGTSDTLHFSEQIAEVGFFFALSLLIYFSYHFIEQKERKSFKYAKSLLNLSSFNLSMTIMLYMSFLGSIVAIMLFKPSPRVLPFKNFEDMADALVEGKIRLVAMDSATGRFTSPGQEFAEQDKTLMKYYQANQIPERVVLVNTVPEAFKLVDEEDRVYVVNLLTARRIPNICDYEIISDKTFPTIPFGFFFSNASPAWFKPDGPLMQKTGDVFQHDMKRYLFPNRCVKVRPRNGLNLMQTSSMFYLLLFGNFFGFIALLCEMFQIKKSKKYQPKIQEQMKNLSSLELIKRLAVEYEMKSKVSQVNKVNEQKEDLWICFRKKRPEKLKN